MHEDVGSSRSGSTLAPSHGFSPKEWAVLWGLYSSQDPHQQESLCADLLTLPAEHINRYLLQYVYLAVAWPSGPLERAVTQLCGRSFNIAVQVSWLLLALLQDQPGNRHVRLFKDACERAALTGSWMSPFEQAANQLDEEQQQQQEEELFQQQQQQQQQQQDGGCGDQAVSTPSQCRSEPASTGAAAAAAGPDLAASSPAAPASPSGSGSGSGSPAGLPAAVNNNSSSRSSSLDLLAHKASSLDLAHRFRNSLDLELMRHTSSQDLHHNSSNTTAAAAAGGGAGGGSSRPTSAAAAAAGKKGVTTSSSQQVQQQQQLGQHGLPAVKTRLAGTPASSSSNSSVQQQTQRTPGPAVTAFAGQSQLYSSSSSGGGGRVVGWGAAPGSAAAQQCSSFAAYLAARRQELVAALGPGEGVSGLIEASHNVAAGSGPEGIGWLVTHEEELSDFLSMSVLLSQPPSCPAQAAARDAYLSTLDFVEALCETSSNLTRFPPADRQRVLVQCLARISSEVEGAAGQGVGVRWPIRGCSARVLRLLPEEAAIMNSRDKAPFLLLLETQAEEVPPVQQQQTALTSAPEAAATASAPDAEAVAAHTSTSQQQQQQESPFQPRSPHKASPLSRGSTHTGQEQAPRPAAPAAATTAPGGSKPQDSQAASGSGQAADRQQQQQQQQAVRQPASAKQQHSEQVAEPLLQRSCPSLLELQMQEAAALLRGEPSTTTSNSSSKLVRVQIRVHEPLSGTGQVLGAAQRDSSRGQHHGSCHIGPTSSSSPSALGLFSPNTQRRALMSGQQQQQQQQLPQWQQRQQQQQQDGEWGSDDDDASEPFLFGEVPSRRLNSSRLHAPSSHSTPASAAAAAAGSSDGPVVCVSIEVLPAGPSVPQLTLPTAPGQRRQLRRRLPSMEAIDIIAGKLGRSALPAPAEIGPPLHPGSASAASSRRTSSELDAAAVDLPPTAAIAAASSGSAGSSSVGGGGGGSSSGTTHMPAVLEGVPAATAAADSGSSDAKPEAGDSRPPKAAAAAAVATAAADDWQHVRAPAPPADSAQQDSSSNMHQSSSSSRGRRSSWAGGQQPQQQQQPLDSPMGLWGRLYNSLGSRQQPQQQQVPPSPQGHRGQQYTPQEVAAAAAEQAKRAAAVFGERWSKVCARAAAASPYGHEPGWGLAGAIVKSGDDCRQELLALQLIRELQDIWTAAGLPLWVRPFEVLVTSADTALIELIPDAISIHTIKARARRSSSSGATPAAAARTPTRSSSMQQQRQQQRPAPRVRHSYSGGGSSGGSSAAAAAPPREQQQQQPSPSLSSASGSGGAAANLADFFFARWQKGTPECLAAQRRFVESLAGYSLATYLLQVKDRHNGNIMMDASGRLIHIDYGFMLSNTPGGGWVRFEAAPLKLTRELLEVMDSDSEGQPSALFDYFKVLCIQGFLAARKERHRLVGLVRIMADCTSLACPSGSSSSSSNTPSAAAAAVGTARVSDSSSSSSSSKRGGRRSSSSGGQQGGAGLPPLSSSPSAAAGSAAVAAGGGGGGSSGAGASWPCFRAGGDRVVSALEARFVPGMAESAVVSHVLWLISTSLDAWSTRTYDYYQLVLNGIL